MLISEASEVNSEASELASNASDISSVASVSITEIDFRLIFNQISVFRTEVLDDFY